MSGCTCEPGVEVPSPHAPWLCRINNNGRDEDDRYDPDCRCVTAEYIAPWCPVHSWLIAASLDDPVPYVLTERDVA